MMFIDQPSQTMWWAVNSEHVAVRRQAHERGAHQRSGPEIERRARIGGDERGQRRVGIALARADPAASSIEDRATARSACARRRGRSARAAPGGARRRRSARPSGRRRRARRRSAMLIDSLKAQDASSPICAAARISSCGSVSGADWLDRRQTIGDGRRDCRCRQDAAGLQRVERRVKALSMAAMSASECAVVRKQG